MKRIIFLTAMILALTAGRALWAEEMNGPMMEGKMKMMGGMHGGMMMHGASMVASNDGGVIVMAGNKLYKYDKDLNLVKEVELKMDMSDTGDMKKFCPFMGKDGAMMKEPAEGQPEGK